MAKIEFERYKGNPIIAPTKNWWETRATFNAGVAPYQDKIVFLYRAMGNDGVSRLGYAESENGKEISKRLDHPVIEPAIDDSFERLGIEDPRITKINDTYWVTCVATSLYEANFISSLVEHLSKSHRNYAPWRVRASLFKTGDFQKYEKVGRVFGDEDDKDVVLFPEKIKNKYIILDRLFPSITISWSEKIEGGWGKRRTLMSPRQGWEEERLGISTVPVKTKRGWLIIFHAADKKHVYRLGFALLDLHNPAKVIYRHPKPILEPKEQYELRGRTPNVVFSCGMIEKGDEFYLYYGGADKVIGLASIKKEKLLNV